MEVGVFVHSKTRKDNERQIYIDILEHNGYNCRLLTNSDLADINNWLDLSYIVYKWTHVHDDHLVAKTILPLIEQTKKIKVFPDWQTSWFYDDKVKQDLQLKIDGFPFVQSWLFYDKQSALDWAGKTEYPLVFKLAYGSGSQNVLLVNSFTEAKHLIKQLFGKGRYQDSLNIFQRYRLLNKNIYKLYKYYRNTYFNFLRGKDSSQYWQKHKNYIYFQKFCPKNEYDTRVSTAGLRAHAFRRFVREGDFRASGGSKWDINPDNIDKRMIRIALDISKHYGFQAMAYDFVYDEQGNPIIVEMSYAYGAAGFPDFMNGYWDYDLNWHAGRFFPQYFELVDLLKNPELKCPDLEVSHKYDKVTFV